MAELKPFIPDLEKIVRHQENREPEILSDREYYSFLSKINLHPGAKLSDKGILMLMERGLIKMWDEQKEPGFDLLKQIQGASIDVRIGHHYWWMGRSRLTQLVLGEHIELLRDFANHLAYAYQVTGDFFTYHANGDLILALTQERVSLSNCVIGTFHGRSTAARLGLSVHQAADAIEPGFAGEVMLEVSNASFMPILVKTGDRIGSLSFSLLDPPSTRPRNLDREGKSVQHMQSTPFGFYHPEWDLLRRVAEQNGLNDLSEIARRMVRPYHRAITENEKA